MVFHCVCACGKSATNTLSAVPGGSITVFSYFLHEHYIGRSIWTELSRNNTLVEYIGAQCNWDFVKIVHFLQDILDYYFYL
jgi:hypothetical protein